MVGASVRSAFAASARYVAPAVLVSAEVRAAAMYALGHARFLGIQAVLRALRIRGDLSAGSENPVIIRAVPVGNPLPHVTGHIPQTVPVGWERACRRRAPIAIFGNIVIGKVSLEGIGHVLAAGHELVAPVVRFAVEPAARRKFELRFCWQAPARPLAVCNGIV